LTHRGILAARPNDTGVRAGFELRPDGLVVTSDLDSYTWGWEHVRIAPWDTTTVRLEVPDGEFFYRADDPLRFADAIEAATTAADQAPGGHWWDAVFSSPRANHDTATAQPAPSAPPPVEEPAPIPTPAPTPSLTERAASIDLSDPWEHPAPATPASEDGSRSARRRRRFGRPKEHAHRWTENSVNGGIVRRVCQECRHVSIDVRGSDPIPAR